MAVKTFWVYSWSPTILAVVLLGFVGHVHFAHGYAYCQYYKPNIPWPYLKECPYECCPRTLQTRENTTCCNPPIKEVAKITIIGHRWWTIFLCIVCLIIALILLAKINRRLHILQHWKNFNSTVGPEQAYTIPIDTNINPAYKYSSKDDVVVVEQSPPCYNDAAIPIVPPYASVNAATKTNSE